MAERKEKFPTENPDNLPEDLESVIEDARQVLNLKELIAEVEDFDKRHKERREKLKSGSRRRTSGRIL